MARRPLGRGLGALLGDDRQPTTTVVDDSVAASNGLGGAIEIDLDLIEPNPQQPRDRFNETALDELAASIRANGIVQPIVVRRAGARFQIVAGERRWRAAQRADLRRVPVVIREIDDDRLLEVALIENIQRQELNPIEEAKAYRKLIDTIGLTQEQVSERVGKERTLITTTMRLLKLPDDIQQLIIDGTLSMSHGRALLMSDDAAIQRSVAREIRDKGLSVRASEAAVKRGTRRSTPAGVSVPRAVDANVRSAETKLMRHLSTNVKIRPAVKGTGGKIEIEYYGTDDLDRLYQLLLK